jgi:hypothetical protein
LRDMNLFEAKVDAIIERAVDKALGPYVNALKALSRMNVRALLKQEKPKKQRPVVRSRREPAIVKVVAPKPQPPKRTRAPRPVANIEKVVKAVPPMIRRRQEAAGDAAAAAQEAKQSQFDLMLEEAQRMRNTR